MSKKLKNFDLLCQSILQEKRANIFTKVFTSQRYLEDDFRQLWKGSGFKKLMFALDNALGKNSKSKVVIKDLPELNVNKMLDLKSQEYQDLPAGTVTGENAGLRLTYDILPQYRYTLLKILLSRDENTNESTSKFGMFINYFNELIANAEQGLQNKFIKHINTIKTDMKLEIIASPTSEKSDSNYTQNKKHTHLSMSGFKCDIFLWFDAQHFKAQLKANLTDALKSKHGTISVSDGNNKDTQMNLDDITKQEKDIESINVNNSKIKLGTQTITISKSQEGTLEKLVKGVYNYNLNTELYKMAGNALGLNKIFGGKDANSQKPDKVPVNQHFWHSFFNIGDINKPYVNVVSKVTLDQWLYKDNYNKSIADIGKNNSTNMAIQQRKPFNEVLLRVGKSDPGQLNTNLSDSKIWRTGQYIGRTIWPENSDMEAYLNPLSGSSSDTQKKITCRWQSYLDRSRSMYAEYRVAIQLTEFYNTLDNIIEKINDFNDRIIQLESKQYNAKLIEQYTKQIASNPMKYLNQNTSSATISSTTNINQFLSDLDDTNIISYLGQPGDNSSVMSPKGINNHITNFDVLNSVFFNNEFPTKKEHSRDTKPIYLKIDNIFSDWWNNIYRHQIIMRNGNAKYDLASNKNLYTNNGKNPNNNITTNGKRGLRAFQDFDTTAAEYFSKEILDHGNNFSINGILLDEFYKKYLAGQITNLNKLKQYFNAIKLFSYTMYKISLNVNYSSIIHQIKQYIIRSIK